MQFDIVAEDAQGRKVLGVEARGRVLDQKTAELFPSHVESEHLDIPFVMVVDRERIRLFKIKDATSDRVSLELDVAEVLSHYDPEFRSKGRMSTYYLIALVDAWLDDLASHWSSEFPPGEEEMRAVGLLQHLEGGTTEREVELGADSVR
jgi:hypothetical protein